MPWWVATVHAQLPRVHSMHIMHIMHGLCDASASVAREHTVLMLTPGAVSPCLVPSTTRLCQGFTPAHPPVHPPGACVQVNTHGSGNNFAFFMPNGTALVEILPWDFHGKGCTWADQYFRWGGWVGGWDRAGWG